MQKLRTFYAKVTDFLCESYGLSMQKLRTFYAKVTDFLCESYRLSMQKLRTFLKVTNLYIPKY